MPVAVSEDIVLAVGEACSNAVEHAYAGRTCETVVVEAHRTPSNSSSRCATTALGVRSFPTPVAIAVCALIAEVMDDVAVSSASDGGTRVEMRRTTCRAVVQRQVACAAM